MPRALFLLFIFCCSFCKAQNLVPNPSFEDYNQCPDADAQFDRVNDWTRFNNSPDYQNACDSTNRASVPHSMWGYQEAASGKAYAGIHSYSATGSQTTSFREYIGVQLLSPLTIGTRYYVNLKVSPTLIGSLPFGSCKYVHNNMGALFTMASSTQGPIPNFAHVYSDSIISDTASWTVISGSFVADSAYHYVVVGNFFDDSLTSAYTMNPSGMFHLSYYFIDDVCVATDSLLCENFTFIKENSRQENFRIYPNPCTDELNIETGANTFYPLYATLYDINGQIVLEEKLKQNYPFRIETRILLPGIYMLVLNDNKTDKKIRFIKN